MNEGLEIRLTSTMQSPTDSVAVRVLRWLSNAVYRYPRLVFYPQLLLFVVSIVYTVERLEFDNSRDNLVGADKQIGRAHV